jgi:copper chaperone CopZ
MSPAAGDLDPHARGSNVRVSDSKGVLVTATDQGANQVAGTAATREFAVGGMTCGSCAARVQRTLGKHPGVEHAEVNFATGTARVALAESPTELDADG